MTVGTALFHNHASARFTTLGREIADLQSQISSGKTDARPSTDPVRALKLSAAREQEARLDRFQDNIATARTRLGAADTALESGIDLMQRVRELAVLAVNATSTPDTNRAILIELRELREGMVDLANTRIEGGRPLFAGHRISGPAYAPDVAGVLTYQGDLGRQELPVSESSAVASALPGPDVFGGIDDGAGGTMDVFQVLDGFIAGLEDPAGVGLDGIVGRVTDASGKLIESRTEIGALGARIELQSDTLDARRLRLQESLSSLEDLDIAKTVMELNQKLLTRDASQRSFITIGQKSLFDYIS